MEELQCLIEKNEDIGRDKKKGDIFAVTYTMMMMKMTMIANSYLLNIYCILKMMCQFYGICCII